MLKDVEEDKARKSGQVFSINKWNIAEGYASIVLKSGINVQNILTALQQRDVVREEKNYTLADELRDKMKTDYGVILNDRAYTWRIATDE